MSVPKTTANLKILTKTLSVLSFSLTKFLDNIHPKIQGKSKMNTKQAVTTVGYHVSRVMVYIFFIVSVTNSANITFPNLIHFDFAWANIVISKSIWLEIISIFGMCISYALTKKFRLKENPMVMGSKFFEDGGVMLFIALSVPSLTLLILYTLSPQWLSLLLAFSTWIKILGLLCLASVLFPERFSPFTVTPK